MLRPRRASAGAATLLALVTVAACGGDSPDAANAGPTITQAPTPPSSCVRCDRLSAFNYRLLLFEIRLTIEHDSPELAARLDDLRYLAGRAEAEGRPELGAALRGQTEALAAAVEADDETAIQRTLVELEQLQKQLPE